MQKTTPTLHAASVAIALKEWHTVCLALASGRQMVLLRKGGISESGDGAFDVAHRRFLLFPTYLHQNKNMLKPEVHGQYQPFATEPERVTIESAAEVTDVLRLNQRAQMDAIDAQHIWTPALIDMRFSYRPENPLYLLIVRAFRLREAVTIVSTSAYAGCKSWVPLDHAIDVRGATAAIDTESFEKRRNDIRTIVQATGRV